jgi:hypothetical protein
MGSMRSRPSHALMVASLAVVVALAGTALAAPDVATRPVTKSTVKKIAKKQANAVVTQRQGALNVNHAKTSDSANSAKAAEHAKTAETAAPTGPAGGALSGNYPNPGFEKTVVPLVLNAGWAPEGGTAPVPAVWKDAYDVVHFRGGLRQTPSAALGSPFTLPPQFRPTTEKYATALIGNNAMGYVVIPPSGAVSANVLTAGGNIGFLNIEEITFEAGT